MTEHTEPHTQEMSGSSFVSKPQFPMEGKIKAEEPILMDHRKQQGFVCTFCNKLFYKKSQLTIHMRYHTKEKTFKCALCEKHFYSKSNVNKHVKSVHKKIKPFSCTTCGQSFAEKCKLKRHLASTGHMTSQASLDNQKQKSIICALCGKQFASKEDATEHYREIHNPMKRFSCTFCEKKFYNEEDLTIHIRFHTKEKPFKCFLCGKHFYTKSSVNEHIDMVHKQLNSFSCTLCGQSFADEWKCKQHVTHHEKAPQQSNNIGMAIGMQPYSGRNQSEPAIIMQGADHENGNLVILPRNASISECNLQREVKPHSDGASANFVVCPICQKIFIDQKYFDKHMNIAHPNTSKTSTEGSLEETNQTMELPSLNCDSSLIKTEPQSCRVDETDSSCMNNTAEQLIKCSLCEEKCNDMLQYTNHLKIHSDDMTKIQKEEHSACGFPDSNRACKELKEEISFNGFNCPRTFKEKFELAEHTLVRGIGAGRKKLQDGRTSQNAYNEHICPGCNLTFTHRNNMSRHMVKCSAVIRQGFQVNLLENVFKCAWCHKMFATKATTKRHLLKCPTLRSMVYHKESENMLKCKEKWLSQTLDSHTNGPGTNAQAQCIKCLQWFHVTEIATHVWKCKTKKACLN